MYVYPTRPHLVFVGRCLCVYVLIKAIRVLLYLELIDSPRFNKYIYVYWTYVDHEQIESFQG